MGPGGFEVLSMSAPAAAKSFLLSTHSGHWIQSVWEQGGSGSSVWQWIWPQTEQEAEGISGISGISEKEILGVCPWMVLVYQKCL